MPPYSGDVIRQTVHDYAYRWEVDTDEVDVSINLSGNDIVGFRLSLDSAGRSRGCDESFGTWGRNDTSNRKE